MASCAFLQYNTKEFSREASRFVLNCTENPEEAVHNLRYRMQEESRIHDDVTDMGFYKGFWDQESNYAKAKLERDIIMKGGKYVEDSLRRELFKTQILKIDALVKESSPELVQEAMSGLVSELSSHSKNFLYKYCLTLKNFLYIIEEHAWKSE